MWGKKQTQFAQKILAFLCWTLFPVATFANPVCNGRYQDAAEMLDAAYGKYETLYSGGETWSSLDNVGATIDLYRLWRNLPDLRFRDVRKFEFGIGKNDPFNYNFGLQQGDNWIQNQFERYLPLILNPSATIPSKRQKYIAAVLADLATTTGPAPDWWLRYKPETLSPGLRQTQYLAQKEPFVDWLQTLLAASDAPWTTAWYFKPTRRSPGPSFQTLTYKFLFDHAYDQYLAGQGIEWGIAAIHFAIGLEYNYIFEGKVSTLLNSTKGIRTKIANCTATPAEYAAYAVMRFEEIRNYRAGTPFEQGDHSIFPQSMRWIIAQKTFTRLLLKRVSLRHVAKTINNLKGFVDDPSFLAWLNVGRTYLSTSIDDLIDVHENTSLDPRSIRALNLLSVDNLIRFANANGRHVQDRKNILTVAFARLVALKHYQQARKLFPSLAEFYPDHKEAIQTIQSSGYPLDVQLALLVLEIPNTSVWLTETGSNVSYAPDFGIYLRNHSKYGIDLPYEFRIASFLQRDLETWLQTPQRWGEYRGMRGYSLRKLNRAKSRGRNNATVRVPRMLPENGYPPVFKFVNLIAWDEISQLGPQTGLSRNISLSLINWADSGTDSWIKRWFSPDEEMANALRRVVYLNRKNDVGLINGKPIGQIAFLLLHNRFSETEAAKATPYWFKCSPRCEH